MKDNKSNIKTEAVRIRITGMDKAYQCYLSRVIRLPNFGECYAENNILHPETRKAIVLKGELITSEILSLINDAGIRNINIVKEGKHLNINADFDGQAYKIVREQLDAPCNFKAKANASTSSGLYYDPELLRDVIAQNIYMCCFPYMAAIKIPVARANAFVNDYIVKYGYNTAKSEIYGTRKRHTEKMFSDFTEANNDGDEMNPLELIPANNGNGVDVEIFENNNIAEILSQGLIKYIRPCYEKNNSLAKALVAFIYNILFFDDTSHQTSIAVLSNLVNNQKMTIGDLGAFIQKHIVNVTGFSINREASDMLAATLKKNPTAKAFDKAYQYKNVSWNEIPLHDVFSPEFFEKKLPVICADHMKSIKYFEKGGKEI